MNSLVDAVGHLEFLTSHPSRKNTHRRGIDGTINCTYEKRGKMGNMRSGYLAHGSFNPTPG